MEPSHEWSFEALGTAWWIGVYEPTPAQHLADIKQQIADRIEQFDMAYSRFRADSLISKVAAVAGEYQFPPDAAKLFAWYRKLYDVSGGAVTPLIGQVLSDAGYDAVYSLQSKTLSIPPALDDVMRFENGTLTTTKPVLLDFGAAGKGYLVDIVGELLLASGITKFCVDASGDMVCHGLSEPLRVGLENPDDASQAIGVMELSSGALCGSAGNRRAWGDYHHIMNPRSLQSPQHIKALWVQADTALHADGLATALFFVEPEQLLSALTFNHFILYADGSVHKSADFPAEIFTENYA